MVKRVRRIRDDLLAKMQCYRISSCHLDHEKVKSAKYISFNRTPEEGSMRYERFGFCTKEVRSSTLGYAHTVANGKFSQLLKSAEAVNDHFVALKSQFDHAVCEIYLLDQRKWEFEKKWFDATDSERQETQLLINKVIQEHALLLKELSRIREKAINLIENESGD